MVRSVKCTRKFNFAVHIVSYVFRVPSHLYFLFRHPSKITGFMPCRTIHCLKIVSSENHVPILVSFHCLCSRKWIFFSNKAFNIICSTLAVASAKFISDKFCCQHSVEMPPWLSNCLVILEEPSWLKTYKKKIQQLVPKRRNHSFIQLRINHIFHL
jgi:hypothetical protein